MQFILLNRFHFNFDSNVSDFLFLIAIVILADVRAEVSGVGLLHVDLHARPGMVEPYWHELLLKKNHKHDNA